MPLRFAELLEIHAMRCWHGSRSHTLRSGVWEDDNVSVKVMSACVDGIRGIPMAVEVDVGVGVHRFDIVGLPETTVKESRVRVVSVLRSLGFRVTSRRVTVNLAPADIRKQGSLYDLPIALGIMACLGAFPREALEGKMFVGELSLDAELRPVPGVLPMVAAARDSRAGSVVVPAGNASEASFVKGIEALVADNLVPVVEFLRTGQGLSRAADTADSADACVAAEVDFADVKGQAYAKRALEVAAAGRHNVLMIGPPGSGKTMLARSLPGILPPMTYEESLETTTIYSVAGLLRRGGGLVVQRPFRAPHHTASAAAVAGGGRVPKPGEVSLAHNGVLFMDELPEWKRDVLEVLRQPLEDRHVTISRTLSACTFPADFLLVGAMNPCPCGYLGDRRKACVCHEGEIARYRARISGPLLDRVDIHVEVPRVPVRDLTRAVSTGECSAAVRDRVVRAAEVQARRFSGTKIRFNGQMTAAMVKEFCPLPEDGRDLLERAVERLGLSARAVERILKVSRTIADLEGEPHISARHVAEAVQYRVLDRRYGP